ETLYSQAQARPELDAPVTTQQLARFSEAASCLADRIASGEIASREGLEKAKRAVAVEFGLDRYVTNSEVYQSLREQERPVFQEMLRVHPRRSGSGIVVVTAFSAPFSCPHGTCVFCPGGPKEGTPQSYMPDSPGMRTALAVSFDPFQQVRRSLAKYSENGHETSKVEAIIEGGTFIAVPREYQESFVKGVYDGLNGGTASTLEEAQLANESAASRCVGLTLESKPDWCRPQDIDLMLGYGITRLEIGVQSLRDATLKRSNRGHNVKDTKAAFQVARDAGLKVTAHMMPGLPGATPEDDLEDLRKLFGDESLRPDMTKLYPTLVVGGTSLERQFRSGLYRPYDLETVVELLSEMKRFVPEWHRIMRIQREIPAREIEGGVKNGNLREMVLARAREKGFSCRCIRCREVALGDPSALGEDDELKMTTETYRASGGTEVFSSYEYRESGKIAGFARLRVPSERAHRREIRNSGVIRELRVYGRVVGFGARQANAWQHKGLGSSLMAEMEKEAREGFGLTRLLVTSAVGTRNYYRRLGYERLGPYMAKRVS
ncbi:MAG: tRNA uridine(34) 5-carboxymethylaminomethyl modification radical SAM/GNAT enzyme Elp3, partial [Nitrososphaerales archaeon]|nr:tRNA uridine(34) 5-carboxymethylaminomethyl modification radical SAM/GNAT enzyme Elp3 [Nitrososphaerales archaeon]